MLGDVQQTDQNTSEMCPNSIKFEGFRRPMGDQTKTAVSVAEMARMVGLSRARFYQLIGSRLPTSCL